ARDRADRWMLFTAAMTLTLYTHYNGGSLLLLAGLTAGLLLAGRPGRTWAAAGVSFAAVVLLLLPWWPVLARLAAAQVGQGDLPAAALQQLVVSVFVPQFLGPGWAMVTGLALIARGLVSLRRDRRLPVMLVWLALPIALIWAAQPGHFVAGRHLSFVLLPLLLLLGQGLVAAGADAARLAGAVRGTPAWLPRATTVAAALLLLVAWASPTVHALGDYYASRQGFDWRVVADVLQAAVPEGEPILATAGAGYPLRHYWRAGIEVLEPATFRPQLEARRASRGAWIVTHEGWDRPAGLTEWLGSHAVLVAEVPPSWSLPGVRVWRTRSPDGAWPAASGTVPPRARAAPGPAASPPPR
ncbi:MAG TPA: hypothetical protein VH642_01920, partial [Streptosporangiaceae bacterium]